MLCFKAMLNSIDFYKGMFLHVIPVCIIVDDNVRISKYKNVFAKGYISNCSEEVFVIEKVKSTVLGTCY